jgi:hypothetical protein
MCFPDAVKIGQRLLTNDCFAKPLSSTAKPGELMRQTPCSDKGLGPVSHTAEHTKCSFGSETSDTIPAPEAAEDDPAGADGTPRILQSRAKCPIFWHL